MAFNGVHTGWEEWIYPTGSIFFYRLIAKKVVLRSSDSPAPKQISDRADWPVAVGDEFDDIAPAEKFGDF
jgi:hypothetical protein